MQNKTAVGHLMAFVTIFIWGTTYISTKILLTELTPVEILFYRFAIASLVLFLIHPKIEKMKSWREELLFFSLGLTGVCLYFLVQNIALQFTLASNAGLLISAAPILTAIVAHFSTHDEKLSRNLVIGFLVAIIGVFLVLFNGQFVLKLNPWGDFLAFLAAILWACYSVLLKKVNQSYHTIDIVRRTFFYGLLTIIPFLWLFKADLHVHHLISWSLIGNVLFLGLAASALCFVMWNKSVQLIGVVKTSNYIYLVPLITMVTSVVVLREKVNGLMFFGGLLIFVGVYIGEKGVAGVKR